MILGYISITVVINNEIKHLEIWYTLPQSNTLIGTSANNMFLHNI